MLNAKYIRLKTSVSKSIILAWHLFCRDFKSEFRQSILGYTWAFFPVIATTATWVFLNEQNLVKVEETTVPYTVHVLVGTMLWGLFSKSLTGVMHGFSSGSDVFTKIKCSPTAFALSGLTQVFFDSLLQCMLLIPAFLMFSLSPPIEILLFPLGMLALSLLGSALGILLIPLASLYGDVPRIVAFCLTFMMYLTPVVYPVPKDGIAATMVNLNPVTPLIETTRCWLTQGHSETTITFLFVIAFSLIIFVVGLFLLRVSFPHLVARMGS